MKKTIKNFIEYSSIDAKLIRAVIRQFGGWRSFQEMAQDIYNHGISSGFNGWIYYNETCQFYAKNQSSIVKLVEYLSEDHDYKSAQDMVKGFSFIDATLSKIGYTLYGNKRQHDTQVANVLAWCTAEEVVRAFVEWSESE